MGLVLDLDVDDHPGAHFQGVGQEGDVGGKFGGGQLADGAHPFDHRVVVDGQTAVGRQADVQLHPVGPERPGPGERVQGVLPDARSGVRTPPVGLDCGSCSHAAYSPQHMTRHRDICVKSHVEAPKLLASVDTAGYSSERTLNGR
jgi:hypothetical protein